MNLHLREERANMARSTIIDSRADTDRPYLPSLHLGFGTAHPTGLDYSCMQSVIVFTRIVYSTSLTTLPLGNRTSRI